MIDREFHPGRIFADPASIELIVLDVDGVLTDGSINIDDDGRETKRFHVRDGFGMKLWMNMGFHLAIITGRSGLALTHRLKSLGVPDNMIIQGSKDKGADLQTLLERCDAVPEVTACMGDDWPDLKMMARAGYPMCPADAEFEVRSNSAFVCSRKGGDAAVREAIAHLLSARDAYEPSSE
jgi:3-deoxy-D-manno-octulosonate 8-phosphate phosphatase (KDO 8-P phosphatase)